VAARFGLGLVDEELDLLDLALDVGCRGSETDGKVGNRGKILSGWRLRRGFGLGG